MADPLSANPRSEQFTNASPSAVRAGLRFGAEYGGGAFFHTHKREQVRHPLLPAQQRCPVPIAVCRSRAVQFGFP